MPAIKSSKVKLQQRMTHSLQTLNGKEEIQQLLQKLYGYFLNDEQLSCASPNVGVIDGPNPKINFAELTAKLDSVGKSSGQAIVITALDLGHFPLDTQDLYAVQLHDSAKFHCGWRPLLTNTQPSNVPTTWLSLREVTVLTETSIVDDEFGLLKSFSHPLQHWALI